MKAAISALHTVVDVEGRDGLAYYAGLEEWSARVVVREGRAL